MAGGSSSDWERVMKAGWVAVGVLVGFEPKSLWWLQASLAGMGTAMETSWAWFVSIGGVRGGLAVSKT